MASNLSTLPYSYDILPPIVAQYGRSDLPRLVYISDFHVVASTSPPPNIQPTGKRCLASCGTALELAKRWNTGNERFDWSICMQIAVTLLSHRAGSAATRTLPCWRGGQCYGSRSAPGSPSPIESSSRQPSAYIQQPGSQLDLHSDILSHYNLISIQVLLNP